MEDAWASGGSSTTSSSSGVFFHGRQVEIYRLAVPKDGTVQCFAHCTEVGFWEVEENPGWMVAKCIEML